MNKNRIGILLIAAAATSGCGAAFVQGPEKMVSPRQRGAPVYCTTNNIAPTLDLIGVGLQTLNVIAANDMTNQEVLLATGLSKNTLIGTSIILASAFWVSADIGFERTKQCRELRAWSASEPPLESAVPDTVIGWRAPMLFPVAIPGGVR